MLRKARVLILAVMTATVMLLGSTAVFAADSTPTGATTTAPTVQKVVTVAPGVTIPDGKTITFTATQVNNGDGIVNTNQYTMTIDDLNFVGLTSGDAGLTKNAAIKIGGAAIDQATMAAGEYTYKITENTPPEGYENTTAAPQEYYLHIYVDNTGAKKYLATTTNTTTGEGANKKYDNKTNIEFTNTYKDKATLEISKAVVNSEYEAADTEYEFEVTFITPANVDAVPGTVAVEYGGTATTKHTGTSLTVSGNKATFMLYKDETITFTNLPAGTQYTVSEKNTGALRNYASTTYQQTVNGAPASAQSGTTTADSQILYTGVDKNKTAFENTFKEVTLTGIITTYLPYIAMILLALGALALYLVSKRRRAARY